QSEELGAQREQAEVRFEELDIKLGEHQMQFSDAEISGEALHEKADAARQHIRDIERRIQEAEYVERTLQARIAELQRNGQLAVEQARRARSELDGLQGELFELDASAAQAGLQDALELRAE